MNVLTRLKQRVKGIINPGVLVLMYHRVADAAFDPWDLCVSPAHFEEQLRCLRQTGRVISMNQFLQNWQSGWLTPGRIVLTFDDGYLDNVTVAKPLLEKYGLPATFFITTQPVREQAPFWWDQLQHLICETPILPQQLSMTVAGQVVTANLGHEAVLTDSVRRRQQDWKATQPPSSARLNLYLALWILMRPLPHQEQQQYLVQLWAWSGTTATNVVPVMSAMQLRELASHPLIDLGVHTQTHPALAGQPETVQHREIADSKEELERLCQRSLKTFAYPYGNYDEVTRQLLLQEGFMLGFTTQAAITTRRSERYQLGRFQIPDWTGQQLQAYLNPFL